MSDDVDGEFGRRALTATVLFKAVTTCRLGSSVQVSPTEVRGRIRLAARGRLRELVGDLVVDAEEAATARAAASAARAAAEAAAGATAEAAAGRASESEGWAGVGDYVLHDGALAEVLAVQDEDDALAYEVRYWAGGEGLVIGPKLAVPPTWRDAASSAAREAERERVEAEAEEAGQAEDVEKRIHCVLRLCCAGHYSKGYGLFSASPLRDMTKAKPRDDVRALHPQDVADTLRLRQLRQGGSPEVSDEALAAEKAKRHVAEPDYMRDEGRAAPFVLEASAFHKVMARVPKERAMFSGDALSYEELGRLYHSSKRARDVLFRLFFKMAAGRIHESLRPLLGDCFLVGLRKPDGGTRPIGIGSALRRLVGRCIMEQIKDEVGERLTGTAPTWEDLWRAREYNGLATEEEARERSCNTPLQLGCGTPGGAEILIAICRVFVQRFPEGAIFSDDKVNGFNSITRGAIFRGLRTFFPSLIPVARFYYQSIDADDAEAVDPRLWLLGGHGKVEACDSSGEVYASREGCQQGDPLGPLLWSFGYHQALLEMQARSPDSICLA